MEHSSSPRTSRSPQALLRPQSGEIRLRVDKFMRIMGSIAGVGAAMAELDTGLSPAGLMRQTAQALLEEGLNTPAALIQQRISEWEQEGLNEGEEREVEDAMTIAGDHSPYQEEGEPQNYEEYGDSPHSDVAAANA